MPRPSPARSAPPFDPRMALRRVAIRLPALGPVGVPRAVLILAFAVAVAGCRATTELGPAQATPTDMGGIAVALQTQGIRVNDLVSGDAGCPDQTLGKSAITLRASGLDQVTPVTVHLFIFNDDAAYQRARPSVDVCARSFVTDPASYEALDQSPYAFVGQGPWGTKFKDAVRAGLALAAKGG